MLRKGAHLDRPLPVPVKDGNQPRDIPRQGRILVRRVAAGPGVIPGTAVALCLVGPDANSALRALARVRVRGPILMASEAGAPVAEVGHLAIVAGPICKEMASLIFEPMILSIHLTSVI